MEIPDQIADCHKSPEELDELAQYDRIVATMAGRYRLVPDTLHQIACRMIHNRRLFIASQTLPTKP